MNNMFVYRGILVKFDERVGWFFNGENGNRFSFNNKDECLEFISKMLIKE